MSADIGAYDPATAKMILDTVKYLKANGYIIQGGQKKPPIFDAPRIHIGVTTSTITGRSGSDAGTGTAVLRYVPGVAGTDHTIAEFPPTGEVEIDIYNIDTAEIADGAHVPLVREYASGKWFAIPSAVNNPQVYVVKATSTITARSGATPGSGTATVYTSLSGSLIAYSPTINIDVYNAYDVAIADEDYFIVCRDDIDQRWWAVPKGGSAATSQRIRGTIKYGSGAGFNSATAADPHVIENIEGIDAVWAGAAELDIYNPEGHKLWDDSTCNVRAEYNATSGQWEVYSAQADQIVHGIRRLECKFEKLDGSDGWDWWNSNPAGAFDAEWVTAVYTDPTDDCNLVFDTDCISGVLAASLDFVERVTWNEYTCQLAVQYRCEDRVTYPGPFTLDFVKDVVWSEGSCELFVYRCSDVSQYSLPFIKGITWSDALCTIVVTYCDNSQAALAMPDFLTNVEYNEDNCMLYVESCSGAFTFYELDFVKDVTLSADNCHLIVDKCVTGETEIQMPYLTDVYIAGNWMVYDTGCTREQPIIEFTDCE